MNILYFVPDIIYKGGILRIVTDKLNYLAENTDWNLWLAHYGEPGRLPYELNERVKVVVIGSADRRNVFCRVADTIRNIRCIGRFLRDNNIDIAINANAPLLLWILPFIHRKTKKIHEFHFSYDGQSIVDEDVFHNKWYRKAIRRVRVQALRRFDRVVALTENDRKKWGKDNTVVIPNFTNVSSGSVMEEHGKTVVSAGRLVPQKTITGL